MRTDGHDKANNHFSQFCERTKKTQLLSVQILTWTCSPYLNTVSKTWPNWGFNCCVPRGCLSLAQPPSLNMKNHTLRAVRGCLRLPSLPASRLLGPQPEVPGHWDKGVAKEAFSSFVFCKMDPSFRMFVRPAVKRQTKQYVTYQVQAVCCSLSLLLHHLFLRLLLWCLGPFSGHCLPCLLSMDAVWHNDYACAAAAQLNFAKFRLSRRYICPPVCM